MADISLLPEDMRGKETEEKTTPPKKAETEAGLRMHIPEAEPEEDIEIIEVDESDLEAVLADEPFMTRLTYKIGVTIDKLKGKAEGEKAAAPPPKLPPQFFKPPKPGMVTKAPGVPQAAPGVPPPKPGVRIAPSAEVPKRVRVIKRVRKQVRVSLISEEQLALLRINVSKRKWTMSVMSLLFAAVILGGYFFLTMQVNEAKARREIVARQLGETRTAINDGLKTWKEYEDLQPRLALLDQVLSSHVVISRLFDFLEERTLPTVAYRSATVNDAGQLQLDVTADSYDSAALQLVAFEESDLVKDVDATAFNTRQETRGEDQFTSVSFQLVLDLDAAKLRGPLLMAADPESVAEAVASLQNR
jgi:Tfp pilus assembly protein PilN